MPDIELLLDELRLVGFDRRDQDFRAAVSAALETELTRLLQATLTEGVPPSLSTGSLITHVNATAIPLASNAHPEAIGHALARSVHQGIVGGNGSESASHGEVPGEGGKP